MTWWQRVTKIMDEARLRGWTLKRLSAASGVPEDTLMHWAARNRPPTVLEYAACCWALGLTVDARHAVGRRPQHATSRPEPHATSQQKRHAS